MVSLQILEHFDVISAVDNGTDMENCCRLMFYNNIDNFDVHFRCARERKKEKQTNKLRHHHVISMVFTLIERSSRQISAREVALLR